MLSVYPLWKFIKAAPLLLIGLSGFTFTAPAPANLTGIWSVTGMIYNGQSKKSENPIIKVYKGKQFSSHLLMPSDSVPLMRGDYTLAAGKYSETITWARDGITVAPGTRNNFTINFLNDQKFVIKGHVFVESAKGTDSSYIVETWEKVK